MAAGDDSGEDDPKLELTDLILRPLKKDDPLRPILKHDLEQRLAHIQPRSDHASAEELTALVRKHPVKPRRSLVALSGLAFLLLLTCILWQVFAHLSVLGFLPGAPPLLKQLARERIFISGADTSFTSAPEYAEQLWRANPEDPVLYYGYLQRYSSQFHSLPPDYHETWSRIDPDNGMWAVYEAESILAGQRSSYTDSSHEKAFNLFVEAAEKPRLHSYREEWLRRFFQHLRMPHSFPELQATRSQLIAIDPRLHFNLPISPMVLGWQLARPDCEGAIAYRRVLDWIEKESTPPSEKALPLNWDATIPALQTYMASWSTLAIACLLSIVAMVMHLRKIPSRGEAGKLASCFHQLSSTRDLVTTLLLAFPVPASLLLAPFAFCRDENEIALLPLMVIPPAWLAMVTTSMMLVDSQVSRQTGILGFNSSLSQRRLNTVMCLLSYLSFLPLIVLWSGKISTSAAKGYGLWLALPAGTVAALTTIALGVKLFFGFAAPDSGIRHRIIARRLLLAMLVMVILLSAITLILHGLEASIIHDAVNAEMSRTDLN